MKLLELLVKTPTDGWIRRSSWVKNYAIQKTYSGVFHTTLNRPLPRGMSFPEHRWFQNDLLADDWEVYIGIVMAVEPYYDSGVKVDGETLYKRIK